MFNKIVPSLCLTFQNNSKESMCLKQNFRVVDSSNFKNLPKKVLQQVFKLLNQSDKISISKTNKKFNTIIKQSLFQRILVSDQTQHIILNKSDYTFNYERDWLILSPEQFIIFFKNSFHQILYFIDEITLHLTTTSYQNNCKISEILLRIIYDYNHITLNNICFSSETSRIDNLLLLHNSRPYLNNKSSRRNILVINSKQKLENVCKRLEYLNKSNSKYFKINELFLCFDQIMFMDEVIKLIPTFDIVEKLTTLSINTCSNELIYYFSFREIRFPSLKTFILSIQKSYIPEIFMSKLINVVNFNSLTELRLNFQGYYAPIEYNLKYHDVKLCLNAYLDTEIDHIRIFLDTISIGLEHLQIIALSFTGYDSEFSIGKIFNEFIYDICSENLKVIEINSNLIKFSELLPSYIKNSRTLTEIIWNGCLDDYFFWCPYPEISNYLCTNGDIIIKEEFNSNYFPKFSSNYGYKMKPVVSDIHHHFPEVEKISYILTISYEDILNYPKSFSWFRNMFDHDPNIWDFLIYLARLLKYRNSADKSYLYKVDSFKNMPVLLEFIARGIQNFINMNKEFPILKNFVVNGLHYVIETNLNGFRVPVLVSDDSNGEGF